MHSPASLPDTETVGCLCCEVTAFIGLWVPGRLHTSCDLRGLKDPLGDVSPGGLTELTEAGALLAVVCDGEGAPSAAGRHEGQCLGGF